MGRVDAIVVGGGAMGSAASWWLARRGVETVLLERFEPGHARGSSHGGSRIFRLAYPEDDYVRMAQESLPLWRLLEEDAGTALLDTTGGLDVGPAASVEAVGAALARGGVAHEVLPPAAAAERWPAFRFEGVVLFQPDAGRCRADDTLGALHAAAARAGGGVHHETPVARIVPDADGVTVVTTDGERWRAPVAVVAAGPWAPKLVEGLPPMVVTREQVFHFRPREAGEWPSFILHRTPWVYGLRTPGEGIKVAEHHVGAVVDPDARTFDVEPAYIARMVRYVEEWFPGLDPEPVTETTCLYTNTATEDFVIDRRGALVVAAGFSGHGFKFTPLIGRWLAALATDGVADIPARFRLPGGP